MKNTTKTTIDQLTASGLQLLPHDSKTLFASATCKVVIAKHGEVVGYYEDREAALSDDNVLQLLKVSDN